MKKFFKKTEGFTLVELIVVIAILGILAGVGTVGYSGYIKKANMAADQVLLDSLNTAFAAACIENDEPHTNVAANGITIGDDKKIEKSDIVVTNPSAKAAAIQNAFEKYYEGGTFKVMSSLLYENGMFKDSSGSVYNNLVFDSDDIGAFNLSAFFTAQGLGVNGVTQKVDFVTDFVSKIAGENYDYENMEGNGVSQLLMGYADPMLNALGFDGGISQEGAIDKLNDMTAQKMAMLAAANDPGYLALGNDPVKQQVYAQQQLLTNYAVLEAAKTLETKETSAVVDMLKNTTNFKDIVDNEDGVANAAMAYGLYTAYAYSLPEGSERDAAIAATNDPMALLQNFGSQGFYDYLDNEDGRAEKDLAGYVAAMNMINDSTANKEAVGNLMLNGFNDPALVAALQAALNK